MHNRGKPLFVGCDFRGSGLLSQIECRKYEIWESVNFSDTGISSLLKRDGTHSIEKVTYSKKSFVQPPLKGFNIHT